MNGAPFKLQTVATINRKSLLIIAIKLIYYLSSLEHRKIHIIVLDLDLKKCYKTSNAGWLQHSVSRMPTNQELLATESIIQDHEASTLPIPVLHLDTPATQTTAKQLDTPTRSSSQGVHKPGYNLRSRKACKANPQTSSKIKPRARKAIKHHTQKTKHPTKRRKVSASVESSEETVSFTKSELAGFVQTIVKQTLDRQTPLPSNNPVETDVVIGTPIASNRFPLASVDMNSIRAFFFSRDRLQFIYIISWI